MQQFSRPVIITSPISGEPTKPTIRTEIVDGYSRQVAIYTDPASGFFIRKVTLSEEKINKDSN